MDVYDIIRKITRGIEDPQVCESALKTFDEIQRSTTNAANRKPVDFDKGISEFTESQEATSVNAIRRQNHIHVKGTDLPDPLESFDSINRIFSNVPQVFLRNLSTLGFDKLTPIQMQAIPVFAKNRNVLACAPTGSGKTLAFLVPILSRLSLSRKLRGIKALILAPSRELANQIYKQAEMLTRNMAIKCMRIKKPKLVESKSKLKNFHKYNVLITTPQRLVYLLISSSALDLTGVKYLVLDEADKLFQTGNQSFREQLGVIMQACTNPKLIKGMFSATYSNDVERWCRLNITDLVQITVGQRNVAVESVEQKLIYAGSEHGKMIGLRNLFYEGLQAPILIFVQTKQRACDLFKELLYDNYMVACIHSNLTQNQRNKVMDAFETGKIWVLICTDLFGRGLDFKNIRVVINYDLPDSAVTYIHRIGRTGRAGERGKSFTFFTDSDIPRMRSIANVVKQSGAFVPEYLIRIKKLNKSTERRVFNQARQKDKLNKLKEKEKRASKKRAKKSASNGKNFHKLSK